MAASQDGSGGRRGGGRAGSREASGDAGGADSGAEEALVGVDVADAVQQILVEERGLDRELAAAEERGEVVGGDGEGLVAGSAEGRNVPARRECRARRPKRRGSTKRIHGRS